MNKRRFMISALFFILFLITSTYAQAALPKPQGFVNDFALVMDGKSKAQVMLIAEKLQKEQGIELAIVTVPQTSPLDPKTYATQLFNEWGIGGPEDSGILILLSTDGAIEVETGYGIEGVLPDGLVGAVIDQEGLPHFRNKQFGQGLVNMAGSYANILAGEEFEIKKDDSEGAGWLASFAIFLLIVIFLRRGRRFPPGGGYGGRGGGRTVIIPGPRMGPRPGGSSGGGFGGFGGGRSGGGGAGRRF